MRINTALRVPARSSVADMIWGLDVSAKVVRLSFLLYTFTASFSREYEDCKHGENVPRRVFIAFELRCYPWELWEMKLRCEQIAVELAI